jgi:hypothetical protein
MLAPICPGSAPLQRTPVRGVRRVRRAKPYLYFYLPRFLFSYAYKIDLTLLTLLKTGSRVRLRGVRNVRRAK